MNLDDAVKAHTMWKMKLSSYIAKPDHSLNAAVVGSPDGCDLGKWLIGEGNKHSNMPEFTTLVANHARFHKAAASIIKKADSGQSVTEEIALGANSAFSSASSEVVISLMAMKRKM